MNPRLLSFILCALLFAGSGAMAQSVAPDEVFAPDGALPPTPALTPAQRVAVYAAIMQQRVRSFDAGISPVVGAAVPPLAALGDLPAQAGLGTDVAGFLKYAMVEGDVVVVDSIGMRVVDVIHPAARP